MTYEAVVCVLLFCELLQLFLSLCDLWRYDLSPHTFQQKLPNIWIKKKTLKSLFSL